MLENCDNKCPESVNSNSIIIGSDLHLCSINTKSTDTISKAIKDLDTVICQIINNSITLIYNDLLLCSFLTKEIVVEDGRNKIKLCIDKNLLCNEISDCSTGDSPFIITASNYNICGNNTSILYSDYAQTVWYNSSNVQLGIGLTQVVSNQGAYYAKYNGKISNIIIVSKAADCPKYSYNKIKNFYKICLSGQRIEFTYSKIYESSVSYDDAVRLANLDINNFDSTGQSLANLSNNCNTTPTSTSCFNVFLSGAVCVTTPIPTSTPTTPIVACSVNYTISNVQCLS